MDNNNQNQNQNRNFNANNNVNNQNPKADTPKKGIQVNVDPSQPKQAGIIGFLAGLAVAGLIAGGKKLWNKRKQKKQQQAAAPAPAPAPAPEAQVDLDAAAQKAA